MVNQTNPSAICCAANISGTRANMRCEGGFSCATAKIPVAAMAAPTLKLAVAEKHMRVSRRQT